MENSEMGTCRACKHWAVQHEGHGVCLRVNSIYDDPHKAPVAVEPDGAALEPDDPHVVPSLLTGPNFGCRLFEAV
jgi:hypothetical protein